MPIHRHPTLARAVPVTMGAANMSVLLTPPPLLAPTPVHAAAAPAVPPVSLARQLRILRRNNWLYPPMEGGRRRAEPDVTGEARSSEGKEEEEEEETADWYTGGQVGNIQQVKGASEEAHRQQTEEGADSCGQMTEADYKVASNSNTAEKSQSHVVTSHNTNGINSNNNTRNPKLSPRLTPHMQIQQLRERYNKNVKDLEDMSASASTSTSPATGGKQGDPTEGVSSSGASSSLPRRGAALGQRQATTGSISEGEMEDEGHNGAAVGEEDEQTSDNEGADFWGDAGSSPNRQHPVATETAASELANADDNAAVDAMTSNNNKRGRGQWAVSSRSDSAPTTLAKPSSSSASSPLSMSSAAAGGAFDNTKDENMSSISKTIKPNSQNDVNTVPSVFDRLSSRKPPGSSSSSTSSSAGVMHTSSAHRRAASTGSAAPLRFNSIPPPNTTAMPNSIDPPIRSSSTAGRVSSNGRISAVSNTQKKSGSRMTHAHSSGAAYGHTQPSSSSMSTRESSVASFHSAATTTRPGSRERSSVAPLSMTREAAVMGGATPLAQGTRGGFSSLASTATTAGTATAEKDSTPIFIADDEEHYAHDATDNDHYAKPTQVHPHPMNRDAIRSAMFGPAALDHAGRLETAPLNFQPSSFTASAESPRPSSPPCRPTTSQSPHHQQPPPAHSARTSSSDSKANQQQLQQSHTNKTKTSSNTTTPLEDELLALRKQVMTLEYKLSKMDQRRDDAHYGGSFSKGPALTLALGATHIHSASHSLNNSTSRSHPTSPPPPHGGARESGYSAINNTTVVEKTFRVRPGANAKSESSASSRSRPSSSASSSVAQALFPTTTSLAANKRLEETKIRGTAQTTSNASSQNPTKRSSSYGGIGGVVQGTTTDINSSQNRIRMMKMMMTDVEKIDMLRQQKIQQRRASQASAAGTSSSSPSTSVSSTLVQSRSHSSNQNSTTVHSHNHSTASSVVALPSDSRLLQPTESSTRHHQHRLNSRSNSSGSIHTKPSITSSHKANSTNSGGHHRSSSHNPPTNAKMKNMPNNASSNVAAVATDIKASTPRPRMLEPPLPTALPTPLNTTPHTDNTNTTDHTVLHQQQRRGDDSFSFNTPSSAATAEQPPIPVRHRESAPATSSISHAQPSATAVRIAAATASLPSSTPRHHLHRPQPAPKLRTFCYGIKGADSSSDNFPKMLRTSGDENGIGLGPGNVTPRPIAASSKGSSAHNSVGKSSSAGSSPAAGTVRSARTSRSHSNPHPRETRTQRMRLDYLEKMQFRDVIGSTSLSSSSLTPDRHPSVHHQIHANSHQPSMCNHKFTSNSLMVVAEEKEQEAKKAASRQQHQDNNEISDEVSYEYVFDTKLKQIVKREKVKTNTSSNQRRSHSHTHRHATNKKMYQSDEHQSFLERMSTPRSQSAAINAPAVVAGAGSTDTAATVSSRNVSPATTPYDRIASFSKHHHNAQQQQAQRTVPLSVSPSTAATQHHQPAAQQHRPPIIPPLAIPSSEEHVEQHVPNSGRGSSLLANYAQMAAAASSTATTTTASFERDDDDDDDEENEEEDLEEDERGVKPNAIHGVADNYSGDRDRPNHTQLHTHGNEHNVVVSPVSTTIVSAAGSGGSEHYRQQDVATSHEPSISSSQWNTPSPGHNKNTAGMADEFGVTAGGASSDVSSQSSSAMSSAVRQCHQHARSSAHGERELAFDAPTGADARAAIDTVHENASRGERGLVLAVQPRPSFLQQMHTITEREKQERWIVIVEDEERKRGAMLASHLGMLELMRSEELQREHRRITSATSSRSSSRGVNTPRQPRSGRATPHTPTTTQNRHVDDTAPASRLYDIATTSATPPATPRTSPLSHRDNAHTSSTNPQQPHLSHSNLSRHTNNHVENEHHSVETNTTTTSSITTPSSLPATTPTTSGASSAISAVLPTQLDDGEYGPISPNRNKALLSEIIQEVYDTPVASIHKPDHGDTPVHNQHPTDSDSGNATSPTPSLHQIAPRHHLSTLGHFYRPRVLAFYRHYRILHHQLASSGRSQCQGEEGIEEAVDCVLMEYRGKEAALMTRLIREWGPEPALALPSTSASLASKEHRWRGGMSPPMSVSRGDTNASNIETTLFTANLNDGECATGSPGVGDRESVGLHDLNPTNSSSSKEECGYHQGDHSRDRRILPTESTSPIKKRISPSLLHISASPSLSLTTGGTKRSLVLPASSSSLPSATSGGSGAMPAAVDFYSPKTNVVVPVYRSLSASSHRRSSGRPRASTPGRSSGIQHEQNNSTINNEIEINTPTVANSQFEGDDDDYAAMASEAAEILRASSERVYKQQMEEKEAKLRRGQDEQAAQQEKQQSLPLSGGSLFAAATSITLSSTQSDICRSSRPTSASTSSVLNRTTSAPERNGKRNLFGSCGGKHIVIPKLNLSRLNGGAVSSSTFDDNDPDQHSDGSENRRYQGLAHTTSSRLLTSTAIQNAVSIYYSNNERGEDTSEQETQVVSPLPSFPSKPRQSPTTVTPTTADATSRNLADIYKVSITPPPSTDVTGSSMMTLFTSHDTRPSSISPRGNSHTNQHQQGEITQDQAQYNRGTEGTSDEDREPDIGDAHRRANGDENIVKQKHATDMNIKQSDIATHSKVRDDVVAIFTAHDPARLGAVDPLLARYHGREDQLLKGLYRKYAINQ